uniref:Endonuclease reverse transcriptase n=1 Tax=Rhipicephalus microplus TaxID=6941 RepID=G0WS03_RHIMP|nr:endonuclease reverse transcriptase [Rhipicephalus microplus]
MNCPSRTTYVTETYDVSMIVAEPPSFIPTLISLFYLFLFHGESVRESVNEWLHVMSAFECENAIPQGTLDETTSLLVASVTSLRTADWKWKFHLRDTTSGIFYESSGVQKEGLYLTSSEIFLLQYCSFKRGKFRSSASFHYTYGTCYCTTTIYRVDVIGNKNTPTTLVASFNVSEAVKARDFSMMYQRGHFPTADCDDELDATVLELRYRRYKKSMVLLLPHKRNGLSTLETALTGPRLQSCLDRLQDRGSVDVRLPKFAVKQTFDLKDVLPGLGVLDVFVSGIADMSSLASDEVDPSSFSEGGPHLSIAVQCVSLQTKEKGHKVGPWADKEASITFTVDHPFMFVVLSRDPEAILLMGSAWKKPARKETAYEIERGGTVITDTEGITRAFTDHYRELFTLHDANSVSFQNEFLPLLPRLDDERKESMELVITVTEVEDAIDKLNPGKSPGPDGFTAAFYKEFKHEIIPILTRIFNEVYKLNDLPLSYRTSHTFLTPKTEDARKLKSVSAYRPIALTNVDYKIYMKVLARRLQAVIKDILGPHQTCGTKGRSVALNIHKARSVLDFCDYSDKKIAMLYIILEKVFDCDDHQILFSVLNHVDVGSVVCEGVALPYRDCTTRLIVNKNLGSPINVQHLGIILYSTLLLACALRITLAGNGLCRVVYRTHEMHREGQPRRLQFACAVRPPGNWPPLPSASRTLAHRVLACLRRRDELRADDIGLRPHRCVVSRRKHVASSRNELGYSMSRALAFPSVGCKQLGAVLWPRRRTRVCTLHSLEFVEKSSITVDFFGASSKAARRCSWTRLIVGGTVFRGVVAVTAASKLLRYGDRNESLAMCDITPWAQTVLKAVCAGVCDACHPSLSSEQLLKDCARCEVLKEINSCGSPISPQKDEPYTLLTPFYLGVLSVENENGLPFDAIMLMGSTHCGVQEWQAIILIKMHGLLEPTSERRSIDLSKLITTYDIQKTLRFTRSCKE